MKSRSSSLLAPIAAALLLLSSCSGGDADDEASGGTHQDIKICMYTHGDSGSFWSVVKNGAEQAAEDLGVTLDYQEADHDSEAQAHLIEDGVDAGCDAMAVSAAEPAALQHAMDDAHDAGIPLVTTNAGAAASQQLHAFTHVGQDDLIAGQEAGTKFTELGAKKILCVTQSGLEPGLDQVCRGMEDTFGAVEILRLSAGLSDLPLSASEIRSRLEAEPGLDAVLSLDPNLASGAVVPAVAAVGRAVTVGAVGLSGSAVQAIKDGTMAFTMDQQPFAQGYLPVVLLYLDVTNAEELGGGRPMYTGPAFVTKQNADRVEEREAAGTR